MPLEDDLRTETLGSIEIWPIVGTEGMHYGQVPQEAGDPFLYYARIGTEDARCLGDPVGAVPFLHRFTIEVIGSDVAQVQDLARAVRAVLNNRSGPFGSGSVQLVTIDDQDDDYVFRAADDDSGFHRAALQIEIFP